MTLAIPRDRAGTFDPEADRQIPAPLSRFRRQDHLHVRPRHDGAGDRGHLEEIYGIEVSPDLISAVTDTVLEAVGEWRIVR
ncbi:transposase [Rhizobium beringeri]